MRGALQRKEMHQQTGLARVEHQIALLAAVRADERRRVVRTVVHLDEVKRATVRGNGIDERCRLANIRTFFGFILFNLLRTTKEQIEIAELKSDALRRLADELVRARHVLGIGTRIRGRDKDVRLVFVRRYRVGARRPADRCANLEQGCAETMHIIFFFVISFGTIQL